MFTVYIVKCSEARYYIGSTEDVAERVRQHNSKQYKSWTNRYNNWQVVYTEQFPTRTEALKRERQIKRMKGGKQFKALVNSLGS